MKHNLKTIKAYMGAFNMRPTPIQHSKLNGEIKAFEAEQRAVYKLVLQMSNPKDIAKILLDNQREILGE